MDELTLDYDRITNWVNQMHGDIIRGTRHTCNREFMAKYASERSAMIKNTEENVDLLKLYCDDVQHLVQSKNEGVINDAKADFIYVILLYTKYIELRHNITKLHGTLGLQLESIFKTMA